jgi:hypothetical protein
VSTTVVEQDSTQIENETTTPETEKRLKDPFYLAVEAAGTEAALKVIETFNGEFPLATKVKRAEHHPAFQTLQRGAQNAIHNGKFKSLAWFVHSLLNILENIHGLEPSDYYVSDGRERIQEATTNLRNLNRPKLAKLDSKEREKREAARRARRLERSQAGPTGRSGNAVSNAKGESGGNTKNARRRQRGKGGSKKK